MGSMKTVVQNVQQWNAVTYTVPFARGTFTRWYEVLSQFGQRNVSGRSGMSARRYWSDIQ